MDTVAALHERGESGVSLHQRAIETLTANLGRPLFLNLTLAFLALWVAVNLAPARFGLAGPFDGPPLPLLSLLVSTGGLLLAILILTTQNRQARQAERRAQLDLQVNLLAEQKIAKLIALVEELRRDLPSVQNRVDPEAEAMSQATDAHAVFDALEEKLDEAAEIVEEAKQRG